ncbi:Terpenoid synthase [Macrophomina phaseolina MS6]|uniref:Terpenoid synthase n=1 Tax=Macrophomina phaseolina (strain MS6) TaxID=1126212 RepID=K2S3J8_MACPH|nr:Terpenoid synthase [Macrophomina phaseolina MS6]
MEAFGRPPHSQGCRSPYGHLAALSLPECLPDRLQICAYIMDYMLHHDGKFFTIFPAEGKLFLNMVHRCRRLGHIRGIWIPLNCRSRWLD